MRINIPPATAAWMEERRLPGESDADLIGRLLASCDACALDGEQCPGLSAHCAAGLHCPAQWAVCASDIANSDHANVCLPLRRTTVLMNSVVIKVTVTVASELLSLNSDRSDLKVTTANRCCHCLEPLCYKGYMRISDHSDSNIRHHYSMRITRARAPQTNLENSVTRSLTTLIAKNSERFVAAP